MPEAKGWVDVFVDYAHRSLNSNEGAREILWARGASEEQLALFKVGYVEEEGGLPPAEYPAHFLEWSGRGQKLAECFLFPLTNGLGEVKGFQFRHRTKKEYMDFFLVRSEPVFFGLGQALPAIWAKEEVVLVEGVFDLFPTQRVHSGTVSTLTAKVSGGLLRTLRRLVRKVFLFYDKDQSGRLGAEKFLASHGSEFEVARSIPYPFGVSVKDPADLWEAWGDERFNPYLTKQLE